MASERRILFVFLDGVGLGADDPAVNALAAARLPCLSALLRGRRPVLDAVGSGAAATLAGLDAVLGMPGLPQSGTGQAALLTGEDAVARFGRHFGPWIPVGLRRTVAEQSILARARAAGLRVAFANAYPEELLASVAVPVAGDAPAAKAPEAGGRLAGNAPEAGAPLAVKAPAGPPAGGEGPGSRGTPPDLSRLFGPLRAGPPLAALGAGVLFRATPELERGEAVSSEIVNDGWRERLHRVHLPRVTAGEAGRNLASVAAGSDLTLYAHYSTDAAGHLKQLEPAVAAMERVDAFLAGVLDRLPPTMLLVVASDHGNLEDCRTGHTRNPALFLAMGPGHAGFATGLGSLIDLAPRMLDWLNGRPPERPGGFPARNG